jgi:hypothetical protein
LHGIKWLHERKSHFMLNPTRVSHQSWFARRQMKDTRVDERRLWALKTKGILDDSNMLGRANVSDETTSVERVLLGHRLLRIFVESLAVVCVLAAMLVGCASPTAIGARYHRPQIVLSRAVSGGGTSVRPRRSGCRGVRGERWLSGR